MGTLKIFYLHPVSHFHVCERFGSAYLKVQSAERAVNGFATTGIYPTIRNFSTDEDFLSGTRYEDQNTSSANPQSTVINSQQGSDNPNTGTILIVSEDIAPIPERGHSRKTRKGRNHYFETQ